MKNPKKFIVPFIGLSLGKHHYEYDIDDSFFQDFEYSEIKQGNLKVNLVVDKQSNMLILDFAIEGFVNVMCDRCLDNFDMDISTNQRLFIKFGEETREETDQVIVFSSNEYEIDVSQYIYEYIVLSLPHKRIHPEGECDPEVIKKLNELKINKEDKDNDPRWDILKNIN